MNQGISSNMVYINTFYPNLKNTICTLEHVFNMCRATNMPDGITGIN